MNNFDLYRKQMDIQVELIVFVLFGPKLLNLDTSIQLLPRFWPNRNERGHKGFYFLCHDNPLQPKQNTHLFLLYLGLILEYFLSGLKNQYMAGYQNHHQIYYIVLQCYYFYA